MPRPRPNPSRRQAKQARAQATVDAILEAAARVLVRQGYAAATTNRVAEAAGVSIGTLYEYFANKDEVCDALIRRELDALVVVFGSRTPDPGLPIHEELGRLIASGMASLRYGPEIFRALEHVPGASFRRQLAEARLEVIGFIERLLEEHRSELRVSDLRLSAFIVVSAVEGVAGNATSDQLDERLARELTALLKLYLTGGGDDGG